MQLFSVNYDLRHICYKFLGLKFAFKLFCRKSVMNKFLKHYVSENTILLVEINCCHLETLIGYYKILKDLGYNVEVIVNGTTENVFNAYDEDVKIWKFNYKEIVTLLQNDFIKNYKCVMFNSKIVYFSQVEETDIPSLIDGLQRGVLPNIYVQHHVDRINETQDKQIILANPMKNPEFEQKVVNPHYFGDVKITDKNEVTEFITVGSLEIARRNAKLLIDAVKELASEGVDNFKISVIGNGNLDELPENIRKYFDIKGRVPFDKLYSEVEKADFFLPLFDPENKAHERYLNAGTSGTFQLVYGFLKPCIIHKKFADVYDFNNANGIVYVENDALSQAMKTAIEMNTTEYRSLQNNLKSLVQEIEKNSSENLKGMLDA